MFRPTGNNVPSQNRGATTTVSHTPLQDLQQQQQQQQVQDEEEEDPPEYTLETTSFIEDTNPLVNNPPPYAP